MKNFYEIFILTASIALILTNIVLLVGFLVYLKT